VRIVTAIITSCGNYTADHRRCSFVAGPADQVPRGGCVTREGFLDTSPLASQQSGQMGMQPRDTVTTTAHYNLQGDTDRIASAVDTFYTDWYEGSVVHDGNFAVVRENDRPGTPKGNTYSEMGRSCTGSSWGTSSFGMVPPSDEEYPACTRAGGSQSACSQHEEVDCVEAALTTSIRRNAKASARTMAKINDDPPAIVRHFMAFLAESAVEGECVSSLRCGSLHSMLTPIPLKGCTCFIPLHSVPILVSPLAGYTGSLWPGKDLSPRSPQPHRSLWPMVVAPSPAPNGGYRRGTPFLHTLQISLVLCIHCACLVTA